MDTQRQNPNNLASLKGAGLLRQEIPLDGSSNKKKSGKDDGPRILFPAKLHNLLTNANDDPNISCTIQWDIHGRSFKVARSKLFEKDVLPKYFKITKMKSFIRQLNLYNFTRITSGRDQGSYYHVDFLRGQYKQCTMIRREKRMAMPKKDYDPEFHTMPFVGTLADPRDEEQKEEQGIKATTAPVSQALSANRDVSYPNPNSGVENNPCLGVFDNTTRIVQSPNANAQVSQGYTNGGWYCPRNVGAQDEAMNQGINQYRTFNTAGDVHVPDMQSGVRQQTGAVPDENSKHQNWSSSPSSSNIQGHRPPFPNHTNMQYHPDLNKLSQGIHLQTAKPFIGNNCSPAPFVNQSFLQPNQSHVQCVPQNHLSNFDNNGINTNNAEDSMWNASSALGIESSKVTCEGQYLMSGNSCGFSSLKTAEGYGKDQRKAFSEPTVQINGLSDKDAYSVCSVDYQVMKKDDSEIDGIERYDSTGLKHGYQKNRNPYVSYVSSSSGHFENQFSLAYGQRSAFAECPQDNGFISDDDLHEMLH